MLGALTLLTEAAACETASSARIPTAAPAFAVLGADA